MVGAKSREALLEFLDYLSRKGLMNKTTASARKAAANKVLAILDEHEAEDLSQLDLDDVMMRFSNLERANYTPDSLNTYKSRVKSAVEDFLSYLDNPMAFKPNVQGAGRKSASRKSLEEASVTSVSQAPGIVKARILESTGVSANILPIPIRPDLVVRIQGIPFDLSQTEANKIANVIKAMAIEE